MALKAVLLDLDGTLVDTAPDLVGVLNQMLTETGRPPMPYAIARNEVSNGALGLIRLGFELDSQSAEIGALRQRFLDLYEKSICIKSKIFKDIRDIIDKLDEYDTRWGIVTNKPHNMTVPLLEALEIHQAAGCVISGDRLPQRKPHPAPLILAAQELGVPAELCVYVGDAPRDIEAGRAAGMRTVAAGYGYIRPGENPHAWGADGVIQRPSELAAALARLGAEWPRC